MAPSLDIRPQVTTASSNILGLWHLVSTLDLKSPLRQVTSSGCGTELLLPECNDKHCLRTQIIVVLNITR